VMGWVEKLRKGKIRGKKKIGEEMASWGKFWKGKVGGNGR